MRTTETESATITSVSELNYVEWRQAYAEFDEQYKDPGRWHKRMRGADGKGPIAVAAHVGQKWAGGFATFSMPMRGPAGELVYGGKMEACIVQKFARKKEYRFGTQKKKVSVAISEALIKASFDAGLQIIYGCPNVPALKAHSLAGHGVVQLTGYYLCHCSSLAGWRNTDRSRSVARFISYLARVPLRLFNWRNSYKGKIIQVSEAPADISNLDAEVALKLPGIGIERSAVFLNWRFDTLHHVILEARNNSGSLEGLLIGQRGDGLEACQIIDFVVSPEHSTAALALIATFLKYAVDSRVKEVFFKSLGGGPLARYQRHVLIRSGFFPFPYRSVPWIADGGNGYSTEKLLDPKLWNGSGIFFDTP